MSDKPEALRLAEQLAEFDNHNSTDAIAYRASEELERLHAEVEALRADAGRLAWLHSPGALDVDGWEWGVFRVKWKGLHVDIQQTLSDYSDLDAAMAKEQTK